MPVISQELLDYLNGLYPDRSPDLSTPERAIWFAAGQADVVKHLKHIFDEQNQNILEGT